MEGYLFIAVTVVLATGLALAIMGLTFVVGPRRPTPEKLAIYECGISDPVPPPERFPVRFLHVAMLFLIFDVEAVAFYPLAIMMRQLGVPGLVELGVFLLVLLLGYAYVWRKGAFQWA